VRGDSSWRRSSGALHAFARVFMYTHTIGAYNVTREGTVAYFGISVDTLYLQQSV